MNSLQRIAAAVAFREVDRVPVVPQVFGHAARLVGVPFHDFVRDGETLARCQLQAWRHYGYDAVFSMMDVNVEPEAVGAVVEYRRDRYPVIERHALCLEDDWTALAVPDPQRAGRMPEMLKALGVLRQDLRDEVLVVGCVLGPFTSAMQLLGAEAAIFLAVDDRPRLEQLMDFATDVAIAFGRAQLRSGAHLCLVFDPSASPAVLPPELFRALELPRLRRLAQAFSESGAAASWLHIAGPVAPILADYPAAGAQIANLDYYVSASEAIRELPATCVDGNIKSVTFIEGEPGAIEAEATRLVDAFRARGGFLLSSGCEIPPESPPANVAALVRAAVGAS